MALGSIWIGSQTLSLNDLLVFLGFVLKIPWIFRPYPTMASNFVFFPFFMFVQVFYDDDDVGLLLG